MPEPIPIGVVGVLSIAALCLTFSIPSKNSLD
jgi:hypothetical protein